MIFILNPPYAVFLWFLFIAFSFFPFAGCMPINTEGKTMHCGYAAVFLLRTDMQNNTADAIEWIGAGGT
jgi:hypothetical protein